jgi:hypothetical protein
LISFGTDYFEFWEYRAVKHLTADGIILFVEPLPFDEMTESIWQPSVACFRCSKPDDLNRNRYRSVIGFESLIVKYYPKILNDFRDIPSL